MRLGEKIYRLVRRFREDLNLNEPDSETFYAEGAKGYTDYPFADLRFE